MYLPSVEHALKQMRYNWDYMMVDLRQRYYHQLKNPRVIHTKLRNQKLLSLRTHRGYHREKIGRFLRLHKTLSDLESVIDLYYGDEHLCGIDMDEDCTSHKSDVSDATDDGDLFAFFDNPAEENVLSDVVYLVLVPELVLGDFILLDLLSQSDILPLLSDFLPAVGIESSLMKQCETLDQTDILGDNFFSAWLDTPATIEPDVFPARELQAETKTQETAPTLKPLRDPTDIWAKTFAEAKAYFGAPSLGANRMQKDAAVP